MALVLNNLRSWYTNPIKEHLFQIFFWKKETLKNLNFFKFFKVSFFQKKFNNRLFYYLI